MFPHLGFSHYTVIFWIQGILLQYLAPLFSFAFGFWCIKNEFYLQIGIPLLIYTPFYLYPFHKKLPGLHWPKYFHFCTLGIRERHGMQILHRAELNQDDQHIVLSHPHGLVAMGRMFMLDFQHFKRPWQMLAADAVFAIPFIRETALLFGAMSASKRTAIDILEGGNNLWIYVGGIKEQIRSSYNGDIYISPRKGGIRLGLKAGTKIVPAFVFGELETFKEVSLPQWLKDFCRTKLGFSLIIPYGFLGVMPFPAQMALVTGKPISIPKVEDPSEELVEKYFNEYTQEIQEIFDEYKDQFGYGHRKLNICYESTSKKKK